MSWLKEIEEIITRKKIEEAEKIKEAQIRLGVEREIEKARWGIILNKIEESIERWEDLHVDELIKDVGNLVWPKAEIRTPRINLFFKEEADTNSTYLKKLIFCSKKDFLNEFREFISVNPNNIKDHLYKTQSSYFSSLAGTFMFRPAVCRNVEIKIDPEKFEDFGLRGSVCTSEEIEEKISSDAGYRSFNILHEHFVIELTENKINIQAGTEEKILPLKEIDSSAILREETRQILKSQLFL